MAATSVASDDLFTTLLCDCKVPAPVASVLTTAGFSSVGLIGHAIQDISEVDLFIDSLKLADASIDAGAFTAARASLRNLVSECFTRIQSSPTPPPTALPESSQAKPKLSMIEHQQLKEAFCKNYPGELLHDGNTPSLLFLGRVKDMHDSGVFTWIPWKNRVSQLAATQFAEARPPRTDRHLLQTLMQSEDFDDVNTPQESVPLSGSVEPALLKYQHLLSVALEWLVLSIS